MKITAIVAEYNPFHNGHLYHMEEAKKITGADALIVVMSGDYVQRGEPAIMPKRMRAEAALISGASVVLELPVYYATGSAEIFAHGAVTLLNLFGCVDSICFGSECGDIKILREAAEFFTKEPDEYKKSLRGALRNGLSFPAARQKAFDMAANGNGRLKETLRHPNNILGIEYLKALIKTGSRILPYTVKREGACYHAQSLTDNISSATAIRRHICENGICGLENQIPAGHAALWDDGYGRSFPVFPDDFSLLLKYRLLKETKESLPDYADVSPELANRIIRMRNSFMSYSRFVKLLKTKETPYSRISRALLHIMLEIKKGGLVQPACARVLGFRKDDKKVLGLISASSLVPLITTLGHADLGEGKIRREIERELFVSSVYESVISNKYGQPFLNAHENPLICIQS